MTRRLFCLIACLGSLALPLAAVVAVPTASPIVMASRRILTFKNCTIVGRVFDGATVEFLGGVTLIDCTIKNAKHAIFLHDGMGHNHLQNCMVRNIGDKGIVVV